MPASSGTFGYDVLKGTERVIHQPRSPFTFSPRGLAKKEDAYKLAQWQIEQFTSRHGAISQQTSGTEKSRKLPASVAQKIQARGKDLIMSNGRLSPELAKQLQITVTYQEFAVKLFL